MIVFPLSRPKVRVCANLKCLEVEELEGEERDDHITAFRRILTETARALKDTAGGSHALERLQRDITREQEGVTYTLERLVEKILGECEAVLKRHAIVSPERYAVDLTSNKCVRCQCYLSTLSS